MRKEEKYMMKAISLAEESAAGTEGGPFGAIIVRGEKIIACGVNTVTSANDPTAHAEINAIREACDREKNFHLKGCVLYTSCEPCPMCLSAAYWAGIEKICYAAGREKAQRAGFSDAFIYDEIPLPIEERSVKMERVLEKEGDRPFDKWLSNDKRIEY